MRAPNSVKRWKTKAGIAEKPFGAKILDIAGCRLVSGQSFNSISLEGLPSFPLQFPFLAAEKLAQPPAPGKAFDHANFERGEEKSEADCFVRLQIINDDSGLREKRAQNWVGQYIFGGIGNEELMKNIGNFVMEINGINLESKKRQLPWPFMQNIVAIFGPLKKA
jgi:hypothetical protein